MENLARSFSLVILSSEKELQSIIVFVYECLHIENLLHRARYPGRSWTSRGNSDFRWWTNNSKLSTQDADCWSASSSSLFSAPIALPITKITMRWNKFKWWLSQTTMRNHPKEGALSRLQRDPVVVVVAHGWGRLQEVIQSSIAKRTANRLS